MQRIPDGDRATAHAQSTRDSEDEVGAWVFEPASGPERGREPGDGGERRSTGEGRRPRELRRCGATRRGGARETSLRRGRKFFTASGSCSRARFSGFCAENPRLAITRWRWPTEYVTPNSRSTRTRMRDSDQSSVEKPAARGPFTMSAVSFARSASSRYAPCCLPSSGIARIASRPPSSKFCRQRITELGAHPRRRATSWHDMPELTIVTAARRRASRSALVMPFGRIDRFRSRSRSDVKTLRSLRSREGQ